jgi:pimeloyl-CoA synthetase
MWVGSDFMDIKVRALQERKSQVKWLKEHHGIDVLEHARTCARFRGLQVGVRYAEVFQQVKKHMQMAPVDLP